MSPELKNTFRNVAGIAICGSLLTTGIGMFATGSFGIDQGITEQTIQMTSIFTSSMAMWSLAMAGGALGYKLGEKFENPENTGAKWRARSAAVGLTLIAASFLMPVGQSIYENVHDGLTAVFNSPESNSLQNVISYQEPQQNTAPAPSL